jgi:phosphocarrier protein HPr
MSSHEPLRLQVVNQRGLHARASAKFVKLAEQFDAQISVSKDGESVLANSIMLGASLGSHIELAGTGAQASEALEALAQLVRDKFGED